MTLVNRDDTVTNRAAQQGLRICIPDKLPRDADAADPGTMFSFLKSFIEVKFTYQKFLPILCMIQ